MKRLTLSDTARVMLDEPDSPSRCDEPALAGKTLPVLDTIRPSMIGIAPDPPGLRKMRHLIAWFLGFLAVGTVPGLADEFPPISDRYDVISDDARAVVKSLKKLEARTEIGVNFVDYDRAVSDVYPDVKVFLDSPEARTQPELRFVLANAMDCHLKVRSLWATKVSSDDPIEKYNASVAFITAQPMLWKVAGANISGASALIDSPKTDLQKVQESIAKNVESLTVAGALRAAEEEEIRLWRESRAQKTGCPVPAAPPPEDRHDLSAIGFQQGDYGNDFIGGEIRGRLPPVYESVPPARQEGEVPLLQGGKKVGRIGVLIYGDVETARKAYAAIRGGFGSDRRPIPSLGNIAEGTGQSVAFRRHTAVVNAYVAGTPVPVALDGLRKVDARVAKLVGDGEPEQPIEVELSSEAAGPGRQDPVPDRGDVAEMPANPVAQKPEPADVKRLATLVEEGDFGKEISIAPLGTDVPPIFRSLPPSSARASARLLSGGEQKGFVAGFVYGELEGARQAFDQVAESLGKASQKIGRVGNEAAAVVLPGADCADLVFRRDSTVVCVRCPVKTVDQIVAFARKIDTRLKGPEEEKQVARPESFDIRALSESAKEMAKEGGEKALYGKIISSIAASKKWVRKGVEEDEPFEGTVVEITPDGAAVFETAKGRVTLRAQELSGDSGARIVRLKEVCRKLAALEE